MKSILFVDDEPFILEGLQRMLFPYKNQWAMSFVNSALEALELMAKRHFDVLVTDMRMPGMDGAQLLLEVKNRHPDTVRFLLSGQTDSDVLCRAVGDAHQFLAKPCKPAMLKDCVDRAFKLRDFIANDRLKSMVSQIGSMPTLPYTYSSLCDELRSQDSSMHRIGGIMETDPSMVAKLLQLVNSGFFGLRHRVTTASQAASLLGLQTIKSLVLVAGLFDPEAYGNPAQGFSLDMLWRHSLCVSRIVCLLCKMEGLSKSVSDDARTSGLLHDVGELILATSLPSEYNAITAHALEHQISLAESERAILGCTHAEIGGYLLGIWGLPDPVVEAVAFHHSPSNIIVSGLDPLGAVHVADVLAHELHQRDDMTTPPVVDISFLRSAGLEHRLAEWRAGCRKDIERG